ncbi:hypothetical protein [Paraburkholderia sp. SIMBA_054]|uniref:hypothetical protein n=1 Tax=Paraburkholderia sp. SIMBA_054 TaxID=3085795 RepID=UPI003978C67B
MSEHHTLLSFACDLAFLWGWLALYGRAVPNSGGHRIAGVAGWLLALVGYLELSASIFTRSDASYHFNAWAMPLDVFEKFGVLAVITAAALIVLANCCTRRRAVTTD